MHTTHASVYCTHLSLGPKEWNGRGRRSRRSWCSGIPCPWRPRMSPWPPCSCRSVRAARGRTGRSRPPSCAAARLSSCSRGSLAALAWPPAAAPLPPFPPRPPIACRPSDRTGRRCAGRAGPSPTPTAGGAGYRAGRSAGSGPGRWGCGRRSRSICTKKTLCKCCSHISWIWLRSSAGWRWSNISNRMSL